MTQNGQAPIKAQYLRPKGMIGAAVETKKENKPTPTPDAPEKATEGASTNANSAVCERTSFKKRPRDAKVDPSTLLCRAVASGEGCDFGDKCRMSHDIDAFWAKREPDLGDSCPVFELHGYCRFGLNCRFGSCHIDAVTKENKKAPTLKEAPVIENNICTKLRADLRKETYPFRTIESKRKGNNKKHKKFMEKYVDSIDMAAEPAAWNVPERKKIDFKNKIYVAPLTTVGNLPFRQVMKQFGADITCGEMAMATNLLKGQASEWALLKRHPCEDIFGVQIAGGFGDQIARCTELITRETNVDFIDINMGCPIDLVCDAGAGSALMYRPKKLEQVVKSALTGIELGNYGRPSMPELTVKMRIGWDHKKPNAHAFVPIVQHCRSSTEYMNPIWSSKLSLQGKLDVTAFTIHGRSRLMRYTKCADWDYIRYAADARDTKQPNAEMAMIGGGDVLSYEEFHRHLESGQLDTCMIARGALIKPWLSTEIKEKRHWDISASERFDILKDFVKFGLQHWGSDQKGVNSTRRFLLEWLSFLCRYVPVGLLERVPQHINDRPPPFYGRNDLETLLGSDQATDWVKISELLLGKVPSDFKFAPKHKANSYSVSERPATATPVPNDTSA